MKNLHIIDDIEVDMESIYSITHNCKPGTCRKSECCCSRYDICIDKDELPKVMSFMPDASRFSSELKEGSAYLNIFDETEDNLMVIDADENGLCVFAFPDDNNHILCSLHTVALGHGLLPHEVKPRSCVTWPLAITDQKPTMLSVSDDALDFPCNSINSQTGTLDTNISTIIKDIFGNDFLTRVKEKARNLDIAK